MTLLEVLVVLVLAAVVIATGIVVATGSLGREAARSALYELRTHSQLARIEAISRNRVCRLLVNPGTQEVLVTDTMGTATSADDAILHGTTLSSRVRLESPDASAAVTFADLGGGWFGAAFDSDGSVSAGEGVVVVHSGDAYRRLSVLAGGGTQVAAWTGSDWHTGRY